jgi:hypothetical protein
LSPAFQSVTNISPSGMTKMSAVFGRERHLGRGSISFLGVGGPPWSL